MDKMTITEALAEIHIIDKRLAAKRNFVLDHAAVDSRLKGTIEEKQVNQARQAIRDLEDRRLRIRIVIAKANAETAVTVDSVTMHTDEWLVWKREIYPHSVQHLKSLKSALDGAKNELRALLNKPLPDGQPKPGLDFHVSPEGVAQELEDLQATYEKLDGKLSHKNAVIFVEI